MSLWLPAIAVLMRPQYIRPEQIEHMEISAPEAVQEGEPAPQKPCEAQLSAKWAVTPQFTTPRLNADIKAVRIPTSAEFAALIPSEPPPFPIQNFGVDCPGLLGQVATYLDAASATASEAGGLAVALPLLGALMGRFYETPTGLRSNIYSVALGGSGTGKTSLVKPAKELMCLTQSEKLMGQDRFASGPAVLKMLQEEPRRISFLDEFGHMLQQIRAAGSNIHTKQILTELTSLYSAANSRYAGTASMTREPVPIDCPHLCLFGMATPEQFWRAFGSSTLEDGSVARYLVFPIGQSGIKEPDLQFQSEIVEQIKTITDALAERVKGNMGVPELYTAKISDKANRAYQMLVDTMAGCAIYAEQNGVKGGSAILRRVAENAIKIALISAVGRNPEHPIIEDCDFNVGHALAHWSATTMIANIASHIADNQYEADVNEVERFIKEAGAQGILKGTLKDRLRRIKPRDFKEIVDSLVEAGIIQSVPTQSDRPGFRLYWKNLHE